jgi:hypothetical protein
MRAYVREIRVRGAKCDREASVDPVCYVSISHGIDPLQACRTRVWFGEVTDTELYRLSFGHVGSPALPVTSLLCTEKGKAQAPLPPPQGA